MAAVKWIKLVSDMFDNRKIKQIRKMPECDAIIVIWLQILCLAGHTNDNGLVYFSKDIPYTDEMLSTEFDRPVATIRLALSILVRFGMIEIVNDILMVSNWEKYQSQTRLESIRDYNREKKQVSRAKQKLLLEDMSMTCQSCPDTDIDIDIELDKEEDKEKDKEKRQKKKDNDIFETFAQGNVDLLLALRDYETMRKSMKNKQLTPRAKELLCTQLGKLQEEGEDLVACIHQSIVSSWLSIYPLKKGDHHANSGRNDNDNRWNVETTLQL